MFIEQMWASVHSVNSLVKHILDKNKFPTNQSTKKILKAKTCHTKSKKENIEIVSALIQSQRIKPLVLFFIEEMYRFNFDESSSANPTLAEIQYSPSIERLRDINLMHHTFGVLNKMVEEIGLKYGLYSDYFFITALLHDFGKSVSLKEHYEIPLDINHAEASGEYLRKILHSRDDISSSSLKILNILDVVMQAQHSKTVENTFYAIDTKKENEELKIRILEALKKSDSAQRRDEEISLL